MESIIRRQVWVLLMLWGSIWAVSAHEESSLTISGCYRGSGCSQCPKNQYTVDPDGGEMLCCPGCATAVLYYGKDPTNWCVCYVDSNKSSDAEGKTLKFPGSSSSSRFPSTGQNTPSSSSSNSFFTSHHHNTHGASDGTQLRDALYTINQDITSTRTPEISRAVHQAITLMANIIEDLNARITQLEDIILHQVAHVQPIDRLGTAASVSSNTKPVVLHSSQTGGPPCKAGNFTRVGNACYYVSVWKDHRAIWEKASQTCEDMGAKLAEPINALDFQDLTQYLSLEKTTTGYSYWTGGLYLGIGTPWLWSYSGTEVNLNSAYWTGVDTDGNIVSPGDPAPGRCLSLGYLSRPKSYYFAADQCGYEKYFVCQLIEKSHRRLL